VLYRHRRFSRGLRAKHRRHEVGLNRQSEDIVSKWRVMSDERIGLGSSPSSQADSLVQVDVGEDLHDSFQSGVRDLFQRRAPRECHGQIKFRQNILDHLANSVFPGNGQTVDVGTPETDR